MQIPSFEPAVVTEGHRGIIYQISWDEGDKHLVSASADGIVKWVTPGHSFYEGI